jgi:hypothetical protein
MVTCGIAIEAYFRMALGVGDISCDIAPATDEESGDWTKRRESRRKREGMTSSRLAKEQPKSGGFPEALERIPASQPSFASLKITECKGTFPAKVRAE